LDSSFVAVVIADDVHLLLRELENALLLQFLDCLNYACKTKFEKCDVGEHGDERKKVGTFSIDARNRIVAVAQPQTRII
jgi:hypothetical protein